MPFQFVLNGLDPLLPFQFLFTKRLTGNKLVVFKSNSKESPAFPATVRAVISLFNQLQTAFSLTFRAFDFGKHIPVLILHLLHDSVKLFCQEEILTSRNPNEAYIPVPIQVRRSDFFPPIGQHFLILTDDNESLDCVLAQQYGKAIETYRSNSILGEYFRKRLRATSGQKIRMSDFDNYGRSDVIIYRINSETYFLNFAVNTS